MKFFNALTLKNKIFITCLGFIILVSILIGLFTRSLLITGLTGELKKRGIGIAQGIADNSRIYILTKNRAELTALAYDSRLGNRKDIVKYLIISDNKGDILAHTFTTGFPPSIKSIVKHQGVDVQGVKNIHIERHSVFHAIVPVKEGIYTVGSVQIGLDKGHIEKLIAKLRWVFLSFLSTVSILLFFLSHRLALHITKPVSSLIRYTDQITQGNLDIISNDDLEKETRQIGAKDDEISKLTKSFIKMTSELKSSTDSLIGSQQKYRSLFKSGPNPIFVVDKKSFEILDANPTAISLFGYQRQELIGLSLFTLENTDGEQVIQHAFEKDPLGIRSKVKFKKKDGGFIYVNIHASPSEYRNEDVIIIAATDISELIEKDSQLIQASKMTNLEKMSAGIAHEINQPLNAIKMGSEYLCMMNERNKKVKEADFNMVINEISTQVSRASEIVGRLKTFSRKADFSREVILVNECILSVNKIIGRQITLQNIDLILDLDESIPPVLAHNNRLEQVIFNLVTNARDAIHERIERFDDIEKGRICISSFFDENTVVIVVKDNGTGIKPEDMGSIFESFYTTKKMGEGLGLGLPIIQGIVRDYNGTIGAENIEAGGASFKLMFPAYIKDRQ